jgi:REP element-mobilizing transposase RayT
MANVAPPLRSILVATPTPAFGDLIRHSLEETGRYRVRVARSADETRTAAHSYCCHIAILDSDLDDVQLNDMAAALLEICPGAKLVLIPPENNPDHPDIAAIPRAALLSKPFYLPDLVDLMDQISQEPGAPANPSGPRWISQPVLDQLLTATSAQAGAVAERGGGVVLGGTLPEGAEAGLTVLLERFWQREERTDLVRFARLESAEGGLDCLIYLTIIPTGVETAAGLVYPIQTPLSKVRLQSGPLIHALQELSRQDETPAPASVAQPAALELPPLEPHTTLAEETGGESAAGDDDSEFPAFNLAELLGTIPSPDPNGRSHSTTVQPVFPAPTGLNDWLPEMLYDFNQPGKEDGGPGEKETHDLGSAEEQPAAAEELPLPEEEEPAALESAEADMIWEHEEPQPDETVSTAQLKETPRAEDGQGEPAPVPVEFPSTTTDEPTAVVTTGLVDDVLPPAIPEPVDPGLSFTPPPTAETVPIPVNVSLEDLESEAAGEQGSVLTTLTSLDQLEAATAGLSQLNYTCVLIPRLPQHYLTRELSEKIGQWVQQLCLAFGWRLEGIALRPDYLQWTVQVAPTISPGNVIKIVRQRTSDLIFEQFEILRKENPSGDFWAAGYLIVSGAQPPSAALLRDFIQQTRRRQGVLKNPGDSAPRLSS